MSWVGLRDANTQSYSPSGLGHRSRGPVDLNGILPTGTLMIEFAARPAPDGQMILDYKGQSPWPTGLSLFLGADGVLTLTQVQGSFHRRFAVPTNIIARTSRVVLRFTWDAPARTAVLSVENIDKGQTHVAQLSAPLPLSLRDAVRISTDPNQCVMSDHVVFAAIADRVMPHGPMPTLSGQTRIPTIDGAKPVADMKAGDLVIASDGRTAQVRAVTAAALPARGRFAPVLLRAPYHHATRDLICSPNQRLRFRGSDVDYLFATDAVAVEISQLRHGVQPHSIAPEQVQTYYQLVLDRPATVTSGGIDLECMDVAPLMLDPTLRANSVLADVPVELLPQRTIAAVPLLRDYEAMTLCRLRAA